jgi:hypothetical protein
VVHGHQQSNPPALARPGFLSDLDELRARARTFLPPGGGDTTPPPCQEATDPTGSIRVVVDARGRLEDVDIGRSWRSRLGEGFTAALFETYTAAREQATTAQALAQLAALEHQVAGPARPDAGAAGRLPEPAPMPEPAPRPKLEEKPKREEKPVPEPADPRDRLAALRARFDRARITTERLARFAVIEVSGTREHTGPHGFLTARLRGYAIVGIGGDSRRFWYAETEQLRQDALDVLSSADRRDGAPTVDHDR